MRRYSIQIFDINNNDDDGNDEDSDGDRDADGVGYGDGDGAGIGGEGDGTPCTHKILAWGSEPFCMSLQLLLSKQQEGQLWSLGMYCEIAQPLWSLHVAQQAAAEVTFRT